MTNGPAVKSRYMISADLLGVTTLAPGFVKGGV